MTVVPGDGYVLLQHGTFKRAGVGGLGEGVAVDPGRAFTLHGLGFTEQASVMGRGRINDKGLAGMPQFRQVFTSTSSKRSSLLWTKVGNANAGAS